MIDILLTVYLISLFICLFFGIGVYRSKGAESQSIGFAIIFIGFLPLINTYAIIIQILEYLDGEFK